MSLTGDLIPRVVEGEGRNNGRCWVGEVGWHPYLGGMKGGTSHGLTAAVGRLDIKSRVLCRQPQDYPLRLLPALD